MLKVRDFIFFKILFYRLCSVDDFFEFIDFFDMVNKTEEFFLGKF